MALLQPRELTTAAEVFANRANVRRYFASLRPPPEVIRLEEQRRRKILPIIAPVIIGPPRRPKPKFLIELVVRHFALRPGEFKRRDKSPKLVIARAAASLLMIDLCRMTTVGIGHVIDRDHSTVTNCIRRLREEMLRDASLVESMEYLRAEAVKPRRSK